FTSFRWPFPFVLLPACWQALYPPLLRHGWTRWWLSDRSSLPPFYQTFNRNALRRIRGLWYIYRMRFAEIIWSSFKMALEEFRANKLRTFLSLFGITVGIFCIIGVLATVDSLEKNVKNDINKLGSKTIYVDKWDYTGAIPWWKLVNRPQ